ncbi:MAG: DUF3592 domain-containing protein [Armatimonadota bacterium]|nr:DUF3592 domain-containing protein [Armatimonadota bacterium]MDR7450891.1 DUF3592 domain-containing protein [Armatimonadota bacterium]MDR7465813.1 DUF3592 domain-containing protein [Armatimonadota bacterium]MDR7493721.1 DUF3592 domain-containing protein [Armatimonadota bacterium]MDR7498327.1 DUF3592 domain-containing protein [Armatimonadota bacterium]
MTERPTTIKQYLVLGFVALLLAGTGYVMMIGIQTNKRRAAEAATEIIEARRVSWWDSAEGKPQSGFHLKYRYSYGGETFEAESEQNTWYRPGMAVKVCLAPADPKDHALTVADQPCGAAFRRI